ncbi:hypothetical protein N7540_004029 [Penicillium herquei]|nr:hypothetical protein N7540_004029 [Penicillium herquei]
MSTGSVTEEVLWGNAGSKWQAAAARFHEPERYNSLNYQQDPSHDPNDYSEWDTTRWSEAYISLLGTQSARLLSLQRANTRALREKDSHINRLVGVIRVLQQAGAELSPEQLEAISSISLNSPPSGNAEQVNE